MDLAQRILKNQFPTLNRLQSTLLQQKTVANSATGSELSRNRLQIIHSRSNHWIVASTLGGEQVQVYDSLHELIDRESANVIFDLFHTSQVTMMNSCKQEGYVDCGVFAIANATAYSTWCDSRNCQIHAATRELFRARNTYPIPMLLTDQLL